MDEIDFFRQRYGIFPKQYISYQRAAYFGKEDADFRLTFDRALTGRRSDLSLRQQSYGDLLMADSGCLTCCVAAALQMQQISVDGLPENADAGEVNQFFSEHGVYDSAGNLLWEMLEQTAGVSVRKQDAAELQDGELDQELAAGRYPIVRVKMPKSGSYHYVLLVGSADGTYLCMDPLQTKEQTVPLSDFGGKIYAVRVLQS